MKYLILITCSLFLLSCTAQHVLATLEDHYLPDDVTCESLVWSPDGTRIAFSSDAFSFKNYDIYVINVDGTNLRRLTTDPGEDKHPSWSHDSATIAFQSDRTGKSQIYLMNADGTNVRQITNDEHGAYTPSFSPDGTKLAISCTGSVVWDQDILLMNPDGTELCWVAASREIEKSPTWSPDGLSIAYYADTGIWRRNIDRTNRIQLTTRGPNGMWTDSQPAWSPAGNKIAYSTMQVDSTEYNTYIIASLPRTYLMNPDGTSAAPLFSTEPVEYSDDPEWSPDGSKLAFVGRSPLGYGDEIYKVNTDGTGLTQITHTVATPTFSPEGGEYTGAQTVTIGCATPGAVIRYTTDGTDPTESSPIYSSPVTVDASKILKAKAWKTDYFPSFTASADYVIQ